MSAMYLQNKYTRWYYQIINNAKLRQPTGYTEKHHIIPRSLGGDNSKNNLVALTAREHFVCHLMLTRMTTGDAKRKMISAVFYLTGKGKAERNNKIKSSRTYEIFRKIVSQTVSQQHKGRKRPQRSKEYLTKQSVAKQGSKNPNSVGYFITPWGIFESSRLAAENCPFSISAPYVANLCLRNNQKPITFLSVCRGKGYLSEDFVGKTPCSLGFSFKKYIR